MTLILHMTHPEHWQDAQASGLYRAASLDSEGFIHCSTPAQIVGTANRFYHDQRGMLLLCIDERKVQPEVRYESPAPGDPQTFPHIYGPLNTDAVLAAVPYEPAADGTFAAPANLPTVE